MDLLSSCRGGLGVLGSYRVSAWCGLVWQLIALGKITCVFIVVCFFLTALTVQAGAAAAYQFNSSGGSPFHQCKRVSASWWKAVGL